MADAEPGGSVVALLTRSGEPAPRPSPPAGQSDEPSDAELIERSRTEPACFAPVFDRHAKEILRYVRARLGPEQAEDVMAETFLIAFRRRDSFDTSLRDARPWLYGIAVREISNRRRAEIRYWRFLSTAQSERAIEDFGDRSDERLIAEGLRPRLAAEVGRLRRRDRELLLLIAWGGLSYEESAEALGTTVSAVKSRLHRIRRLIRERLGGSNPMNGDTEDG